MIKPLVLGAIRSRIWSLIGVDTLLAIGSQLNRRKDTRPTAAQLMSLDNASFAEFIRGTGLKTISTSYKRQTR